MEPGRSVNGDLGTNTTGQERSSLTCDVENSIVVNAGSGKGAAEVQCARAVHDCIARVVLITEQHYRSSAEANRRIILDGHWCPDDNSAGSKTGDVAQDIGLSTWPPQTE